MLSRLRVASAAACVVAPLARADLRSTPFGPRPSECVFGAPTGAVISAAPVDGSLLLFTPGSAEPRLVRVPGSCHAHEAARREAVERASATAGRAAPRGPVPDGWLSSAGAYYTEYTAKLREMAKFTGQFTVPPAPPAPHRPETIYYFFGLEDRSAGALTSIHQPVLTWGDETEGGLGGWHLWSWTCCPRNVTWHSEDIAGVGPGDTIYGRIEKTADATWTIDSAFRDGSGAWQNTTLVSQVGDYNFNYADVTLEVYNISDCEQMPHGTSDFTELEISLSDGSSWVPPTWYVTGSSTACEPATKIHNAKTISISTNGGSVDELTV